MSSSLRIIVNFTCLTLCLGISSAGFSSCLSSKAAKGSWKVNNGNQRLDAAAQKSDNALSATTQVLGLPPNAVALNPDYTAVLLSPTQLSGKPSYRLSFLLFSGTSPPQA